MCLLHRTAAWRSTAVLLLCAVAGTAMAADVSGFRSAKFGDKEAAVRVAAARDLGVKSEALEASTDAITGVKTIFARMPNFAPLYVPATVAYALGSTCQCLIEVTIRWQLPESGPRKAEALGGATALVDKFVKEGWDKDRMVLNRVVGEVKPGVDQTLMLFRGQQGKAAITMLGGPVRATGSTDGAKAGGASGGNLSIKVDDISTVILVYDADLDKPDVGRADVRNF